MRRPRISAAPRRRPAAAWRHRLELSCLLILVLLPSPGGASTPPRDTAPLDLIVVLGRDPRLILPATILASRLGPHTAPLPGHEPLLPLLVVEPLPERLSILAAFVARLAPRRSIVLVPRAMRPRRARAVVAALGLPASALHRGSPVALLRDRSADGEASGPLYLVDDDDLEAALLATVAAGRTGGFLAFVALGDNPRKMAKTLAFPSLELVGSLARRWPVEKSLEQALPLRRWPDPTALARLGLRDEKAPGADRRLVVTNPADTRGHFSPPRLSLLAPFVALEQGAELRIIDGDPETIEALAHPPATAPDTLTLVGDGIALRQREIEDPDDLHRGVKPPRRFALPGLIGLDRLEAAEIATGRLAALDLHELSLQLSRQQASRRGRWPQGHRALMLANVDRKFRLGETISRATVQTLEAGGFTVEAHYGQAAETMRRAGRLPGNRLIIWEGHPRDLGINGHLGLRRQLLDARLVVLQGCYTLERNDASALGALGAESILGTTMPVYSASGSALAKVFLDAQLQQGATAGQALVHARNFTLATLRLKKKRGSLEWRRTWRAGLAFELWGDPTARPLGETVPQEVVRLIREGDTLRFVIPEKKYPPVTTETYTATVHPGGQLGSLLWRETPADPARRQILEIYFGWVKLPQQAQTPKVRTDLPDDAWAMVWAPTRRLLYLLVRDPQGKDAVKAPELTFRLAH